MCIGNTTSPAATNTTNVSWGDAWERPEVIPPGSGVQNKDSLKTSGKRGAYKRNSSKSQSSKTSGGTY